MWVFSAVRLYILVSIFGTGQESSARWEIFLIAIASAIFQAGITAAMPTLAGLGLAILGSLALIGLSLVFWCGVERQAALKIAGCCLALCVGVVIVSAMVGASAHEL